MFTIKRDLREKMGEPAFEDRTIMFCRVQVGPFVARLTDRQLLIRIRHCIAKARSYGMTWESSISIFVAHMLSINPEFDKQPAIQAALKDEEVPVNDRMTAMLGPVSDDDWEDAAMIGDPDMYWAVIDKNGAKES